ncbi:MAG: EAL domain-containing protein, partial [Rhizobiales bacterium]|nr:EAL domain-containing protein [Hyphomicrobiales bacterium]
MAGTARCTGCADGIDPPFPFTMAFQPIVDVGEPAPQVLGKVSAENQYRFDQACRVKAIELAGRLLADEPEARVSINFMPNAVYEPAACIRTSLAAAARVGLATHRIVFEFSEAERVADVGHVRRIVEAYRDMGFLTAIDDFGSGFSGLRLLSDFNPDVVKLDMQLLRGLDADPRRRTIVGGVARMARDLGITVV